MMMYDKGLSKARLMILYPPEDDTSVPDLLSVRETRETSTTSHVFYLPDTVADGDFLLAHIAKDGEEDVTVAGWTTIINQPNPANNTMRMWVGWRVASSEPASYTATMTGSAQIWRTQVMRITGVHGTPVASSDYDAQDFVTSIVAPTVSPAMADTLVLRLVQVDSDLIPETGIPDTADVVYNEGVGAHGHQSMLCVKEIGPSAGQPTGTFTVSGFDDNAIAATVALAPAA